VLTQERLKELLHYNPETGIFIWLISKAKWLKAGDIAGCIRSDGYISIRSDGRSYYAHRLAWLYMEGRWPSEIDHIDHDNTNNKWINLREVSHSENLRNRSMFKNNRSGVIGVCWNDCSNKWKAQIVVDGKTIHLGLFVDKFEAICTRKSAEFKFNYHENHGNPKLGEGK